MDLPGRSLFTFSRTGLETAEIVLHTVVAPAALVMVIYLVAREKERIDDGNEQIVSEFFTLSFH